MSRLSSRLIHQTKGCQRIRLCGRGADFFAHQIRRSFCCDAASLQNSTGILAQTLSPDGVGVISGMQGYMFCGVEAQAPATCESGVGTGANNYNLLLPMPPLRQQ
jgi:hypothetical protein